VPRHGGRRRERKGTNIETRKMSLDQYQAGSATFRSDHREPTKIWRAGGKKKKKIYTRLIEEPITF